MNKEQLKRAIENKIEVLEKRASMLSHTHDYPALEIAISNLYIALSNIK